MLEGTSFWGSLLAAPGPARGCQEGSLEMLLQVLEPIRPALDVDNVAPVQELVQNRRGHELVLWIDPANQVQVVTHSTG